MSPPRFTIRSIMLGVAVAGVASAATTWIPLVPMRRTVCQLGKAPNVIYRTKKSPAPKREFMPNGPDAFAWESGQSWFQVYSSGSLALRAASHGFNRFHMSRFARRKDGDCTARQAAAVSRFGNDAQKIVLEDLAVLDFNVRTNRIYFCFPTSSQVVDGSLTTRHKQTLAERKGRSRLRERRGPPRTAHESDWGR